MKVGTDGVLLGAWAALGAADRRLLDVGTGTGLIALMLAQRSPAAGVTALDIDAACAEQARANADRFAVGRACDDVLPRRCRSTGRRSRSIWSSPIRLITTVRCCRPTRGAPRHAIPSRSRTAS